MAATTACRPNTYLAGTQNGLAAEDMELNRDGHSTDPKADTALQFARKVAKSRGHMRTRVSRPCAAGYTDAQIVDLVAETAFSFSNQPLQQYFQDRHRRSFPDPQDPKGSLTGKR